MPDDKDEEKAWYKPLFVGLSKIKLPTGAFGKTCWTLFGLAIAFAVIVVAVQNAGVAYAAIGAILILGGYVFHRLFNFIEKNPSAALLEGAEFTRHEQFIMSAKNLPAIPNDEPVQEPDGLIGPPRTVITTDAEDPREESEDEDA